MKKNYKNKIIDTASNHLVSLGFHEIITNSLISAKNNLLNNNTEKSFKC